MKLEFYKQYLTNGGWIPKLECYHDGKYLGACYDKQGNNDGEAIWDANTGICLQRGTSTSILNTEPFNIISEIK